MFRQSTFKTLLVAVTLFLGTYLTLPTIFGDQVVRSLASYLPSFMVPKGAGEARPRPAGRRPRDARSRSPGLMRDLTRQLQEDVRRVLRTERVAPTGGIVAQNRGVAVRIADAAGRARVLPKLQELSQPITNSLIGQTGQRNLEVVDQGDGLITLTITDAEINDKIGRAVNSRSKSSGGASIPRA